MNGETILHELLKTWKYDLPVFKKEFLQSSSLAGIMGDRSDGHACKLPGRKQLLELFALRAQRDCALSLTSVGGFAPCQLRFSVRDSRTHRQSDGSHDDV